VSTHGTPLVSYLQFENDIRRYITDSSDTSYGAIYEFFMKQVLAYEMIDNLVSQKIQNEQLRSKAWYKINRIDIDNQPMLIQSNDGTNKIGMKKYISN
jgi:hypothetical protein